LTQRFGFNLKYYRAHQVKDFRHGPFAAGAYLFKVDPDNLRPF